MKIKGTAVRTLPMFIKERYGELYDQWFEQLPPESKKIFEHGVYPSVWFPVTDGAVVPLQVLARILGAKDEDLAFELGRYSGQYALRGVYKIFVSISSVAFLVKNVPKFVSAYYDVANSSSRRVEDRKVEITIGQLHADELLVLHRTRGWMHELVLYTQKTDPDIRLDFIPEGDDLYTGKFTIIW